MNYSTESDQSQKLAEQKLEERMSSASLNSDERESFQKYNALRISVLKSRKAASGAYFNAFVSIGMVVASYAVAYVAGYEGASCFSQAIANGQDKLLPTVMWLYGAGTGALFAFGYGSFSRQEKESQKQLDALLQNPYLISARAKIGPDA